MDRDVGGSASWVRLRTADPGRRLLDRWDATLSGPLARPARSLRAFTTWLVPSSTGLVVGVLLACISLTPSLLPRPWLAQGLITGVCAAAGYGIGAAAGATARLAMRHRGLALALRRTGRHLTHATRVDRLVRASGRDVVRRTAKLVSLGLVLTSLYLGSTWQRELYLVMGLPPPSRLTYLRVPLVGVTVLAGFVAAGRGVRRVAHVVVAAGRRWLPEGPIQLAGIGAGLITVALAAQWVTVGGFETASRFIWSAVNDSQRDGVAAPTSPLRSGGPGSPVSFSSLGVEGRDFVSGGPTAKDILAFDGGDPATVKEPIRVYAGLNSTSGTARESEVAVSELERTGAFDRTVLCVVTTTGTGWIDPYIAAALEYEHRGDTAIVGVQYSYLPSWISFLTERQRVAVAGPELFDAVFRRWSQLPANHRPQLVVFAESLGSLGSEAGFGSLENVVHRTDGVLWTGPTNANPIWQHLLADRDPGSPEVLPVVDGGRTVRFARVPADLARPAGPWAEPRVVYLQNASDPVTWWSPRLLFGKPDWLAEARGPDVLPAMHWFPVVTFVQVTADLALAYGAPPGHGHRFHTAAAAGWAAVTSPPDWSDARSEALTRLLGP